MVQKLINRIYIENEVEMSILPEANYFTVKCGEFRQYYVNSLPDCLFAVRIPRGAHTFGFEGSEIHRGNIAYGKVTFYTRMGNVLNTYDFLSKSWEM
jgi:hypothetical protein